MCWIKFFIIWSKSFLAHVVSYMWTQPSKIVAPVAHDTRYVQYSRHCITVCYVPTASSVFMHHQTQGIASWEAAKDDTKKKRKVERKKKQNEKNEREERKGGIERTGSKEMNTQTLFHTLGLTSLPLTTLQFQSQIFRVPPWYNASFLEQWRPARDLAILSTGNRRGDCGKLVAYFPYLTPLRDQTVSRSSRLTSRTHSRGLLHPRAGLKPVVETKVLPLEGIEDHSLFLITWPGPYNHWSRPTAPYFAVVRPSQLDNAVTLNNLAWTTGIWFAVRKDDTRGYMQIIHAFRDWSLPDKYTLSHIRVHKFRAPGYPSD